MGEFKDFIFTLLYAKKIDGDWWKYDNDMFCDRCMIKMDENAFNKTLPSFPLSCLRLNQKLQNKG